MLYEKMIGWLMFAWVGSGAEAFKSLIKKYQDTKLEGTIMFIHTNGDMETREYRNDVIN